MPGALNITIDDEASPFVEKIREASNSSDVKDVMGRSVASTVREYLQGIAGDSQHHKSSEALGAERTGFYEQAARSIGSPDIEEDGFSVSIRSVGFAQRYFGGTIHGNPVLTIPARAEAYGQSARSFDNLQIVIFGAAAAALVDKNRENKQAGLQDVYYWLVPQVTQEGDETILPKSDEMLDPAVEAAMNYLERVAA